MAWGLGVVMLGAGRRLGISGLFEEATIRIATRVVRPLSTEIEAQLLWKMQLILPWDSRGGYERSRTGA